MSVTSSAVPGAAACRAMGRAVGDKGFQLATIEVKAPTGPKGGGSSSQPEGRKVEARWQKGEEPLAKRVESCLPGGSPAAALRRSSGCCLRGQLGQPLQGRTDRLHAAAVGGGRHERRRGGPELPDRHG